MKDVVWDYPGQKENVQAILDDFDREAHILIHNFVEIFELENYEVTPFSVGCISAFIWDLHYYDAFDRLPEDAWKKCIMMYMRLIEIDYEYLEEIHALMRRRN